jgi:predicted enzyme related to lactoylglutathione lyase
MKVIEIVIACFNLEETKAFYRNVFDIHFQEIKIPPGNIYEGPVDGIKITLCPASIAGIKAKENRHQLTFQIDDVKSSIEKVEQFGGGLLGKVQKANDSLQVAIKDVDGNSIILKQILNH